jgi:hypothetical protein
MSELDAEDAKLVVLARGAMGRAEAAEGAAVHELDGRTYAGAPVRLSVLRLTAPPGCCRRRDLQRRNGFRGSRRGAGGRGAVAGRGDHRHQPRWDAAVTAVTFPGRR